MNTSNILINTQSSIKLVFDKIIYFDPYEIKEDLHDADIIFVTHNHYDHMDNDSIDRIKNKNTIIVAPKSMEDVISKIEFKDYIYLDPFDEINIGDINVKTIPSYNINKSFHPRSNNWLGYIINYNNVTYYIAGDTDITEEAKNVKCDVAFVPIGGTYTMNVDEATELIRNVNPKVVIPIHYGSIVGDKDYGKLLMNNLFDTSVEVIEKIVF